MDLIGLACARCPGRTGIVAAPAPWNRLLLLASVFCLGVACAEPQSVTEEERLLALALIPPPALEVVSSVDAASYAGRWYQQAALPQPFNQDCDYCTIAEYGVLAEGVLSVSNQCRAFSTSGELRSISGAAYAVPGSNQAIFGVEFFPFVRGPYYIIALAVDYRYAMVGDPYRGSLFLLSRSQTMATADRQLLEARALELGFDTTRLVDTVHMGCSY